MPVRARLALAAAMAVGVLLVLPGAALALEQKLVASDGVASSAFGRSVDVDGDTAVVGAPSAGGVGAKTGAVYVFKRTGDSWTQTAKLTASDGAFGDSLGTSVAIDGDTIVAGAYFDKVGLNSSQGSVYTFARTGAAARNETAKLTAVDGAKSEFLGEAVAIDGDTIVAGARSKTVGSNLSQGAVYTFATTGAAARTSTAKLTASDGASADFLGESVAIDGETIVAGADSDNVGANADQGSAYTFARTGAATRTETAKLTASDGAAGDDLGESVAVAGDTIVAGADADVVGGKVDQGSAYTFAATGAAARTQTAKLTASDGAAGDFLGDSVAIDGDTIAAGADYDDVGANVDQGSASTFTRTGTQTAKLTASDGAASDFLGASVAVDGATTVAGAPGDDIGTISNQGSASIFFAPVPKSKLTVTKAGSGSGSVTSAPGGIDCGADCTEDYDEGTKVTLTANAAAGSTFTGFTGGGCAGAATTCEVTVDQAKSVTATFALRRALTVTKAGNGSGSVTSDPAGIDCGTDCDQDYDEGTKVTLTANPAAGSSFTGFTGGGCTGAGATCEVTLDQAKNMTATFALRRALTVTKAGKGSGRVTSAPGGIDCGADCTEDYDEGTKVTLTANPVAGSTFTGFTGGGCSGAATTCEVTMSQAQSVTATFAVTPRALTVTKAGNGSGTVTSDPAGIDCGTDCDQDFDEGTKVTLTANPAAGSTFTGFTGGGCSGAATTCEVTLDQAKNVTATFALRRALTVTKAGSGSGSVTSDPEGIDCGADCGQDFDEGTKVTLTANPVAGSTFTGFTGGGCTGAATTCEVTMSQAQSMTAAFAKKPSAPSTPGPGPAPAPGRGLSPPAGDGLACPAGSSRGVRCTGRTPSGGLVIVGTKGDDTIVGTGKGDRITGGGGRDKIRSGGGNDSVSGGSGSDNINAGSGNDTVHGGSGNDRISGGAGRDRLSGGSGNDSLAGNSGRDRLSGNSGRDRLVGGSGKDKLSGGSGKDKTKQ